MNRPRRLSVDLSGGVGIPSRRGSVDLSGFGGQFSRRSSVDYTGAGHLIFPVNISPATDVRSPSGATSADFVSGPLSVNIHCSFNV